MDTDHRWAQRVLDGLFAFVGLLSTDGILLKANRAALEAIGAKPEDVIGVPFWLTPWWSGSIEDQENLRQAIERCAKGEPSRYEVKHRLGGRTIITDFSLNPMLDDAGQVEYLIPSSVDITDRVMAQREREEANRTLEAVIETAPLAIFGMDFSGIVRSWNCAAERMFGWTKAEVLGRLLPIIPAEDRAFFEENLARASHAEMLTGTNRKRRHKDGSLIDVDFWTAVQRDSAGRPIGVISIMADVAERKRLESQLQQAQRMEAVGRLAGGVAHDFNNLLVIVNGYSRMVLERLDTLDPLHSQVQEILKAGNRAADLTRQLLAFSRRQIIQPQIVHLNKVVSEMDRMLRRLIGEDVELAVNLEPSLGMVKADPSQIEQVIMNLALNSRDAMPNGGKLTIETVNEDLPAKTDEGIGPGRFVVLRVRDTGIGMDAETQSRIFEPFFTTKEKGKGTGLGLSTAYGIVRQSNGYISVSAREGEGATFTIRLPRVAEKEKEPDVFEAEQMVRGSETILLVEDEAGVRKLIEAILRHGGYKVLEAPGAEEAIALCESYRGPIHLLLTDVVMPGMSGREMAERLCKVRKDMLVLYMSGYTDDAIVRHGVLDTGVAFLPKPFTPESLGQKVREVLEGNRKAPAPLRNPRR